MSLKYDLIIVYKNVYMITLTSVFLESWLAFFFKDFGICFHESSDSHVQTHIIVFLFIASAIECEATVAALQHLLLIAVSCGLEHVKFEKGCQ
jgi:hypothetical protein